MIGDFQMKLKNDTFKVDIVSVETNRLNLEDDGVFFREKAENQLSKSHIITIDNGVAVNTIILVGDMFLYDEYCAVLENSVLTVLQNDFLVQIDLNLCQVIKYKPIEEFGGNFELHLTPVGYFVYGESAVATYDKELNQIWRFSGKDIFVALNGKPSFRMTVNTIQLYDFEDNYYELDFGGKLITEMIRR